LVKGRAPADAVQAVDELQRRFWVSAWQSGMFNRVLARRLEDDTLDVLLPGDIAVIHANGAMFRIDHATAADPETQERVKRFEISPTGPLWGAEMMTAEGAPGDIEREALASEGVDEADLPAIVRMFGDSLSGTRRALRVKVETPEVEAGSDEHGHFIRCAFELPPGSFATSVMRELMKTFPLECTHIARRGDHPIYGRDPSLAPTGTTNLPDELVRIDTIAQLGDELTNRYASSRVDAASTDGDPGETHASDQHVE
jgi:tRNA(Glu) U13 pseudouridine synthase TruD